MGKLSTAIAMLLFTIATATAQQITFIPYEAGDYTDAKEGEEAQGADLDQPGEDAEVWDYGTIDHASTGYRFFKFENTGTSPLVISKAKGSCGCTVPTFSKEPILPGETSYIMVRYDTKRKGAFTKYVTLTTNIPDNPTTRLKITGTVNDKVAN